MRIHLKILVVLFLFVFECSSAQSLSRFEIAGHPVELKFAWRGDSMFARWEPHASLMIPVQIEGCPRVFFMQFDLGSPVSMLYRNTVEQIAERYTGTFDGIRSADTLPHFSFTLGQTHVRAHQIAVKPFGESHIRWEDTTTTIVIGTLGTDLVEGRSFLIHYPTQVLTLGDSIALPQEPGYPLSDFIYVYGRILLPAEIAGKKTMLFFDPGSSAFSLLTDKSTAIGLAIPGAPPVTYRSQSWGRALTISTLASAADARVAGRRLPLKQVSYVEDGINTAQADQMRRMGIQGVTGNALFLQSILFIDTKHRKVGIW